MAENKNKIQTLEGALDKAAKKQKVSYTKTLQQIDLLLNEVTKCKSLLTQGIYLLIAYNTASIE